MEMKIKNNMKRIIEVYYNKYSIAKFAEMRFLVDFASSKFSRDGHPDRQTDRLRDTPSYSRLGSD